MSSRFTLEVLRESIVREIVELTGSAPGSPYLMTSEIAGDLVQLRKQRDAK